MLGAQKCGSSAMFNAISKHPHIVTPRLLPGDPTWLMKEPTFWTRGWQYMPLPILRRFPLKSKKEDPRRGLIGSVIFAGGLQDRNNVAYAYGKQRSRKLRFIIMTRNPTLRTFSWYEFGRRRDQNCVTTRDNFGKVKTSTCQLNPWGAGWFHPSHANTSFYTIVKESLEILQNKRKICDYLYCDGNMSLRPGKHALLAGRFQGKYHVSMITHGLFGPQLLSWIERFHAKQFGKL